MDSHPDRFAELVTELERFCGRLSISRMLRDEVLSESRVVIGRHASAIESMTNEEAIRWVRGVAFLVARNEKRSSFRRSNLLRRMHGMTLLPAGLDTPSEQAIEALVEAMGCLSDLDRSLMVAHVWEQRSTEELVRMFGLPAGTIRSRLSRSRQVLREKLTEGATNSRLPDIQ